MAVAGRCLELGIEQAQPGKRLGDIGHAVQKYAEDQGFSTVRELGGHAVGRELRQQPVVLHHRRPGTGIPIVPASPYTIDPMTSFSNPAMRTLPAQRTLATPGSKRS